MTPPSYADLTLYLWRLGRRSDAAAIAAAVERGTAWALACVQACTPEQRDWAEVHNMLLGVRALAVGLRCAAEVTQ